MRNLYLLFFCLQIALCSSAQFKNIKLAEQANDGQAAVVGPSIAINKLNPLNIVVGIAPDLIVTTPDKGATWSQSTLSSPFGAYGDPIIVSSPKGNLFHFGLADPDKKAAGDGWLDRIICQESIDAGKTWNEISFLGNNPPTDQYRPWPAVHPRKNLMCMTWTQFDTFGNKDPNCQSTILFSKSLNGKRWSKPVQVSESPGGCLDDGLAAEGAVPAIGSDGKIYVAWANRGNVYFDRSFDEGTTWLQSDLLIAKQEGGWAMTIPGLKNCNGLPMLAIDNGAGRFHGELYLVWADQKNGKDDTDIWLIRSLNRGDYWSKPVKINKDSSRTHQYLPRITVDPTNGHVYIVYYDRRNYQDSQTDVYLAYSTDGGNSFNEVKISESPFTPNSESFFGDYTNIDAFAGIITPTWTRADNGLTSIWACVIKDSELPVIKGPEPPKKKQ